MCGLIGFVGAGVPADLDAGADLIRRRGPDSLGSWRSGDGRVHLRHARLAISDVRPVANQPISDPRSGQTIAFNGEIYNHLDLRQDVPDYDFCSESDTETLLALFGARWTETLRSVRGMFAICIVDEREGRVLLARDPVGKKPLFLLERPEGVYFGSSVLALAAAAQHVEIDAAAARRWWSEGFCEPHESLIVGCRPLIPGEAVTLSMEGKRLASELVMPPDTKPIHGISVPDAIDETERLLRIAVRRRLTDNPNPVALLSGGVDSTLVSKIAIEAGVTRLLTLRAPTLAGSSDEAFSVAAADVLGCKLDTVSLRIRATSENVASMVDLQDEPLGMVSFVPMATLALEARTGSRVLLTGDGGDEVFCGYGLPGDWVGGANDGAHAYNMRSGPSLPIWMSRYARDVAGHQFVGHSLCKLDRATAEQAVEARSPMLDWDLMAFVRALPQGVLLCGSDTKPLARAMLRGWPDSFVKRPKESFIYRLRWLWALAGFSGLRDAILGDAQERFREHLPLPLRADASRWQSIDVLRNFDAAYKLYVWSRFQERLAAVVSFEARPDADIRRDFTGGFPTSQPGVDSPIRRLVISAFRRIGGAGLGCPACGNSETETLQARHVVTRLERCVRCRLRFVAPSSFANDAAELSYSYSPGDGVNRIPSSQRSSHFKRLRFNGTPMDAATRIALFTALGKPAGREHILDFGCSWGYSAWQFVQAGYRVTGFESSHDRCGYAISAMGVTAFSDERALRGPFDIFHAAHVLERVRNAAHALRLARRVVRPGGFLVLSTANGADARRNSDPAGWESAWGGVFSNLIDDEFYCANLQGLRLLLTSQPCDLEAIASWAGATAPGVTLLGDLTGGELLCLARIT